MDTLSIIITLVSVLASILQIILFFKVWGMCNDIKAMREATASTQESDGGVSIAGIGLLIVLVVIVTLLVVIVNYL